MNLLRLSEHFNQSVDGQRRLKKKLQSMNEYKFEELVADLWKRNGWEAHATDGSRDRGIDVVATRSGITTEKQIIQVKRYSEGNKVGSQDIRNYATLHQQEPDADSVAIVTSSSFTKQATTLGEDLKVKLINGNSLCRNIIEITSDSARTGSNDGDIGHTRGEETAKMSDNSASYSRREVQKWMKFMKRISNNAEDKVTGPFADYVELLKNSGGEISRNDLQFHKQNIAAGARREKKRIEKLRNIDVPDTFNRTEPIFNDYLSSRIDLINVTISIHEKGIENFDDDDLNRWMSKNRKASSSRRRLEDEMEKSADELNVEDHI